MWKCSARVRVILGLLLLLGVALWIVSGGAVLSSRDRVVAGYSTEDSHGTINLFLSYGVRQRGIPFLFLYIADGPAVSMSLSYTTSNMAPNSVLRFDELRVLKIDGSEIDLRGRISNGIVLISQEETTWDGERPVGVRRYLGGGANCGTLIDVQKGFKVQLKARVFSAGEVVETVDVKLAPVFHKEVEWHSGWNWYFNM